MLEHEKSIVANNEFLKFLGLPAKTHIAGFDS